MNWSARGGARSSLHYGGEGVLIHPPYRGVCRRHDTEEQRVTSGGLAESLGGTRVSRPISESERVHVSRRTAVQYQKRRENGATEESVTEVGQGRQPAKRIGERKRTR
jgi:hypothetical protein